MKRIIYSGFGPERTHVMDHLHNAYGWAPVFVLGPEEMRSWTKAKYPRVAFHEGIDLRSAHFDWASAGGAQVPLDEKVIAALAPYQPMAFDLMEDTTGWNFSYHERRAYYYDLLKFWNTVIHHVKPDVFVSWTFPHVVTEYVLYHLCKYYGIPVLFHNSTPLFDHNKTQYYHVGISLEEQSTTFKDLYASQETYALNDDLKAYFHALRSKGGMVPPYIAHFWDNQEKVWNPGFWSKWSKEGLRLGKLLVTGTFFEHTHSPFKCNQLPFESSKSKMNYLQFLLFREHIRKEDSKLRDIYSKFIVKADLTQKYIYFAAAFQPEAGVWSVYQDQFLILDMLSASVPKDWVIYYKEHPSEFMVGGKGSTMRSPAYYEKIATYTNVRMISCEENSFQLIDNAQAVVTPSGTVGWESVVRGIPVLIFGSVWYQDCKGIFRIETNQDCVDAITQIKNGFRPDPKDVERFAACVTHVAEKNLVHRNFVQEIKKCQDPHYEMERIAQLFHTTYERNYCRIPGYNLSVGFWRSARTFPHRPALDVNNQVFTYAELSAMAQTLRHNIKDNKTPAEKLVALLAYRSPTAFAGVLGILGAGCGYVPLHPDFPTERNLKVLELSEAATMVVGPECEDAFEALLKTISRPITFIAVGMNTQAWSQTYPIHRFIEIETFAKTGGAFEVQPVAQDDIAYLLFTSGSTGEPKGVPVSHRNARAYVGFVSGRYDINEHDRVSQMHDMTFDNSIHDIYVAWEIGACVCVASKEDKFLPVSFIQKKQITMWFSVPSVAGIIDKYGRLEPGAFPFLRYSFFAGEALYTSIALKWQVAAPNGKLVNTYGPTETTVTITYFDWDSTTSPNQCRNGLVPLGWVYTDNQGMVVREDGKRAGVDEPGELWLCGSQVTREYWKNPKQTAAQYVRFPDTGDVLWYRSGDLAVQGKDGCLHYLGRIDNQVKIQGNRVELGAIDEVLRQATGVELAVSIPLLISAGNASSIVAFVAGMSQMNEGAILEHCRNKLPKYMVPTKVRFINEMPMNRNGKVDRMQLQRLLEKEVAV